MRTLPACASASLAQPFSFSSNGSRAWRQRPVRLRSSPNPWHRRGRQVCMPGPRLPVPIMSLVDGSMTAPGNESPLGPERAAVNCLRSRSPIEPRWRTPSSCPGEAEPHRNCISACAWPCGLTTSSLPNARSLNMWIVVPVRLRCQFQPVDRVGGNPGRPVHAVEIGKSGVWVQAHLSVHPSTRSRE